MTTRKGLFEPTKDSLDFSNTTPEAILDRLERWVEQTGPYYKDYVLRDIALLREHLKGGPTNEPKNTTST